MIYSIPFVFTVPAYVMADNNIGTDKMFIQMHEKKTQQAKKKKKQAPFRHKLTQTSSTIERKKEKKPYRAVAANILQINDINTLCLSAIATRA